LAVVSTLKRAASSASPNAGSREALVRALAAHIASLSENKLAPDAIDPDAKMCERGYLDSFTYVSFLVFIEETYGVRIPDHQLTGRLQTVSAVADFILRGSEERMTRP
jgi:acyl carrier protein